MKQFIILHHSATAVSTDQFASINQAHKQRGFTLSSLGFYVGYNYLLEKGGQVKQARADQERGCHTVSTDPRYPDLNRDGIGICLAGDFTKEKPTAQQIVLRLQQEYKIGDDRILQHREVKATACPGTDLRAMIMALRTKPIPLDVRLDHAENGLKFTQGSRKLRLARLIERLRKLLG
jgi:hypothetical protein